MSSQGEALRLSGSVIPEGSLVRDSSKALCCAIKTLYPILSTDSTHGDRKSSENDWKIVDWT